MRSVPSVPGVEVGAAWPAGCEQMLTAEELELPATCSPAPRPRGGLVSANASRPRRLRYGAAHDLRIGVTVVVATGGRTPVSPVHLDGHFDSLAPVRKECVHARRLPAGL
jgi:hypothetical protein